jgi:NDP-sugar pyrophosphorylase family protein
MTPRAGVIAAGRGERLASLGVPKPLVPVGGVPLVERAVRGLLAAGLGGPGRGPVVVLVNEAAGAQVAAHLAARFGPDEVEVVRRTTPSSAVSFCLVAERLAGGPFVISTVDGVYDPAALVRLASAAPAADLALAVTRHVDDERPVWVRLDRDGWVTALGDVARPAPGTADVAWVTAGVYRGRAGLLDDPRLAGSRSLTSLRDLLGRAVQGGLRVAGIPFPAVIDVDRPEDLREAERFVASQFVIGG